MSNRARLASAVLSSAALATAALASVALLACSSDDGSPSLETRDGPGATPSPSGDAPSRPANPSPPAGGAPAASNPAGSNEGGSNEGGSNEGNDDLPLAPGMPDDASGDTPANGEGDPVGGEPVEPTQEALPELPSVRQEHAVVALAGEIYVLGGFTPSVTSTLEAFDPASNTWRSAAAAPYPLHHANAAAIEGRLYVAGFYLGASFAAANGRVLEYDPAQDVWSERGLMPDASERASACVAALGSSIYLFGGARLGASVTDASAYDVATDSWTELPPLPEPREHCVAAEIGGTLFIAAGRNGSIGAFEPSTWAFDPVLRTYTARAPIPTPRGGVAGAAQGGKLFILGGEGNAADPSGVFDDVEGYDPATDTWQVLPPMLAPRHGLAAAALDGRIYLPGGASGQGFGAVNASTMLVF